MAKRSQAHRLAGEVAEASRVDGGKRTGYTNQLIYEAQRLQRLLTRKRRASRELKAIEKDIRHSKRMLRALAGAAERVISAEGDEL